MLISSVDLPCKRSRRYFEHKFDVNQNSVDDGHDDIASTSYDLDCSQCSATSSFQEENKSPTRSLYGSTRAALGEFYGKDQFKVIAKLGEGFFGDVFKVKSLVDAPDFPKYLVMKVGKVILNNGKKNARISARKAAEREAHLLSKLSHPNILTFRGMCVERENNRWSLHLLVDFCNSGSLQQLILNQSNSFPWIQRCLIALEISSAMSYVNSKGFMHRDLTAMNILLQSERRNEFPKVIVADFGLSAKIPKPSDKAEQVGTQDYMAPEMLLEQRYTEKADVFSFGVIVCQMIARIEADHDSGLCRNNDFGIEFEEFAKICPKDTPKEFFTLAFDCCRSISAERPSFQQLHDRLSKDIGLWKQAMKRSR